LLFIPADKDFAGGVAPRNLEGSWAEQGLRATIDPATGVLLKTPTPPVAIPVRRRFRGFRFVELLWVWMTGLVMLLIAGVVYLVAHSARDEQLLQPAIVRPTPAKESRPADVASDSIATPTASTEAPAAAKTASVESVRRLDEATLVGEWIAIDQPLEGVGGGDVFALSFSANGVGTMKSRSVLDVVTIPAKWTLSGSKLSVRFGDVGGIREIELTVELLEADRVRLASPSQKPTEFRRVP
jgi:hypothetical protein